jgi:hypothetical protein
MERFPTWTVKRRPARARARRHQQWGDGSNCSNTLAENFAPSSLLIDLSTAAEQGRRGRVLFSNDFGPKNERLSPPRDCSIGSCVLCGDASYRRPLHGVQVYENSSGGDCSGKASAVSGRDNSATRDDGVTFGPERLGPPFQNWRACSGRWRISLGITRQFTGIREIRPIRTIQWNHI